MTPQWDDLCRRAGLPGGAQQLHELEHDAQQFADALVAAFRGAGARRPSAAPLKVTKNGAWF